MGNCGGNDSGSKAGNDSEEFGGTVDVPELFFHPVVERSDRSKHSSVSESIEDSSSHKSAFLRCPDETIDEILIVVSHSRIIHLIGLHPSENNINRVGQDSERKSTKKSSSSISIGSSLSPGVRVQPVVEVAEASDSSSGVG